MARKRMNPQTKLAIESLKRTPGGWDAVRELILASETVDEYGARTASVDPSHVYPVVAEYLFSYNRNHMTLFEREAVMRMMIGIEYPAIVDAVKADDYFAWRHARLSR